MSHEVTQDELIDAVIQVPPQNSMEKRLETYFKNIERLCLDLFFNSDHSQLSGEKLVERVHLVCTIAIFGLQSKTKLQRKEIFKQTRRPELELDLIEDIVTCWFADKETMEDVFSASTGSPTTETQDVVKQHMGEWFYDIKKYCLEFAGQKMAGVGLVTMCCSALRKDLRENEMRVVLVVLHCDLRAIKTLFQCFFETEEDFQTSWGLTITTKNSIRPDVQALMKFLTSVSSETERDNLQKKVGELASKNTAGTGQVATPHDVIAACRDLRLSIGQ